MNRYILASCFAAALVATSYAGDTQSFTVSGTNPDGSAYSGTATLTELQGTGASGDVFKVVWTLGGGRVEGTAMVLGDDRKTLYVSYPVSGGVGVAVFAMKDGNTMRSEWIAAGQPKIGREVWTPAP